MTPIPPETLLAALNWRYAVKKFDPTRRISDATWAVLEQALVLTPSSIGLQPWQFVVITDPAIKAQLRPAAYQQAQTEECSHLVVFAVHRDLGPAHVDRHIARMTEVHGTTQETHAKFRDMVVRNLDKARAAGTLDTWQTHQIYIALGNFMTAAAVIGVDTCPMEGIDPLKFDALLGLTGTPYATVVVCAAGYRLEADKYAVMKKVRFPAADVVKRV